MTRISDLTLVDSVGDGDEFPVSQGSSGRTRAVAFGTMKANINATVNDAVQEAVDAANRAEVAAASVDPGLRGELADGVTAGDGADLVAFSSTETMRQAVTADRVFDADLQNSTDPLKGARLIGYQGATVADKLLEIVAGAATQVQIDESIDLHNADGAAHPALSAFITSEADRATSSANNAESARDAALLAEDIWPTTAAGIGQGVAGTSALVAGSAGTNGTFSLAFSGGTQVLAPKGRFVVVGGAVTQVIIDYSGYYSAGTPTISFAASSGLTGASVSAVMGANTQVSNYFSIPGLAGSNYFTLYRVDAGPVATLVATYPSGDKVPAFRGTTAASSLNYNNFNQMLLPGWYYNIDRACFNTPYGTFAAIGSVYTEVIGPDQARQTYYKDGLLVESWARTFSLTGPTFSAWKKVMGFGPLNTALITPTSFFRGSTANAVDDPVWGTNISNFNLLIEERWYKVTNRFCSNTPYGTAIAEGTIEVVNTTDDMRTQTYYKDGKFDEVWSRYYTPSTTTFTAWEQQTSLTQKIPGSRTADNFPLREELTARVLGADRDFNKALLAGVYTSNGSVAMFNTPIGTGTVTGTLVVSRRLTTSVQTFYNFDSPYDYWERTFTATPAFSAWVRKKIRNAGKSWTSLGDSITSGTGAGSDGSYAPIASRYMGVTLTNKGFGGAAMAFRAATDTTTNANSFARITAGAAMAGFDLITVAYGTNDFGSSVPLGTLGVSDEATFYGAMELGYSNIIAANPAARVVFVAPTYRQPDGSLQTYRDAIVAFCASKGLRCIEPNKQLGWNAATQATFLGDSLHPNPIGYEAYGRFIAAQIEATW
jgi:lysophospholipase L1-like esterase